MVNCAVSGCKNYSDKGDKKIRYYSFPTSASDEIKRLWISACNRKNKFNTKNAKVCAEHFTDDDWRLEDRLLNVPPEKRRLKHGAVPTKNLIYIEDRASKIERNERAQKRKRKQLINEILSAEKSSSSEAVVILEEPISPTENTKFCDMATQTEVDIDCSKDLDIRKLLAENRSLKTKLKENEKQCNDADKLKSLLYDILTPEQMKSLAIAIQKKN